MANNYLDGHGLNAGLGNSAKTHFPSVVDSKPMQVKYVVAYYVEGQSREEIINYDLHRLQGWPTTLGSLQRIGPRPT